MTAECIMPRCSHPVAGLNRADQPTCHDHTSVVVSGSWVVDGPKEDAL